MPVVKFGDVVDRVNYKVDKDNTHLEYYVGGEHLSTGEMTLTGKGIIKGSTIGPMFYFGFKAGDILFVSRNPHLKKAAMVDFDGVCSEKTFVLKTKDENVLLQQYLAIVMQTEHFWQFLSDNKSGSVNFFVNWSTLARYEFDLPDLAEQERLAKILLAAEDLKREYNNTIEKSLQIKNSLFDKYFNIESQIKLSDCLIKIIGGGTPSRSDENNFIGEIPWATVKDISDIDLFKATTLECINEKAIKNSSTNLIDANSLIIATRISLDRAFINTVPMCINQDLKALILKENMYNKYVYYWHKASINKILSFASGTTVLGIRMEHLKELSIPVPEYQKQIEIAETFSVVDDQIQTLKQNIINTTSITKQIINSALRRDNNV